MDLAQNQKWGVASIMTTILSRVFALILATFSLAVSAAEYYVSAEIGDIANPGTLEAPFPRIQQAADKTEPGDTVFVMDGEYKNITSQSVLDSRFVLQIRRSGTSDNWITYRNLPGHKPKLKFNSFGGIAVWASYIKIQGFEIEGNLATYDFDRAFEKREDLGGGGDDEPCTEESCEGDNQGVGIAIDNPPELEQGGYPHHIIIEDNVVYNTTGGGISSIGADYLEIKDNLVYRTAWYSPRGQSGISVLTPRNFDDRQDVYRITITGNASHSSYNFFPCYCPPAPFFERVSDGNGIILDRGDEIPEDADAPYSGRYLVANNLVYNNGAMGINVLKTANVDVFNNTAYGNLVNPEIQFASAQIAVRESRSIRVYNNIAYTTGDRRAFLLDDKSDASTIEFANNLAFGDLAPDPDVPVAVVGLDPNFLRIPEFKPFGTPPIEVGLFDDTDYHISADFRVPSDSPAVDAGRDIAEIVDDIDHQPRPQITAYDIGAYEANGLAVNVELDPTSYSTLGDQLFLEYRVANLGDNVFSNIVIADDRVGEVCTIGGLWPGVETTCTAVYFTTSEDIDRGEVTFSGTFVSDETQTSPVTPVTASLDQVAEGEVFVDTSVLPTSFSEAGERLTIISQIENRSTLVLTGVNLSDPVTGISCNIGSLWPGVSTTCTMSYYVTDADVAAGSIVFQPTAIADQAVEVMSASVTVTSGGVAQPPVEVSAAVSPEVFAASGEQLVVTISIDNVSDTPLTNISVEEALLGAPLCVVGSLWLNTQAVCTGVYTTTRDDVARGSVNFTPRVTAEGYPGAVEVDVTASYGGLQP